MKKRWFKSSKTWPFLAVMCLNLANVFCQVQDTTTTEQDLVGKLLNAVNKNQSLHEPRTDTIIVRVIYPEFLQVERQKDSLIELGIIEEVSLDTNVVDTILPTLPDTLFLDSTFVLMDSLYLDSIQNPAKYDTANPLRRLQLVSKKTFDFFPVDVLNRFNSHAPFFFDGNDRRVKSVVFKTEEEIPQVWFLRKEIDTNYFYLNEVLTAQAMGLRKNVVFEVNRNRMEGDLADYLNRLAFRKEFRQKNDKIEITLCDVNTKAIQPIIDQLKEFRIQAMLTSPLDLLYFNQSGN